MIMIHQSKNTPARQNTLTISEVFKRETLSKILADVSHTDQPEYRMMTLYNAFLHFSIYMAYGPSEQ